MLDRRDAIRLGIGGLGLLVPGLAQAQDKGQFSGNPLLESLQGQKKKLREEFRYRDPGGRLWTVPNGYVSDGASIPRVLWTVAGGPWDGSYDDAAILHDYYCDKMVRSWEATHQMFCDAMLSRGLSKSEATKKHWAVHYFGPRWDQFHRWTSVLQINKQPRGMGVFKSMIDRDAAASYESGGSIDWSREWGPAESVAPELPDGDFVALQEREFRRVSQLIETQGLGPEDIPALEPELHE